MKKLKQYPEYYDSEVEWLRNVPSHWEVVKSKRIFVEASIKGFPNEELLAATQTKGVIPKSLYGNTTVTATKNFETLKLVEKGDFVISLRSFQGGIEYAHYRGIISPAYTILKPQEEVVHKYYRYLLKSKRYISGLTLLVTGIREGQNIDTSKFKDSYLPLPPKQEQTTIANFLDYKTEKINRFITQKKQLIELLHEQKAAIINQAVTKGINPNVPMKDSGIEWLGEIPKNWSVKKVKEEFKFNVGFTPDTTKSRYYFPEDNIWVNISDLTSKYISSSSQGISEEYIKLVNKEIVPVGSLLYSFKLSVGKVAITKKELYTNEAIFAIYPSKDICIDYFYYSLPKQIIRNANENIYGAKILNQKLIKNAHILIPPLKEQEEIVTYLNYEVGTIEKTISTIEKEISLVEEYKTALIAEAVTGKIDVRKWSEPLILAD